MNKTLFLFAIITLFLFSSCGKDKDATPATPQSQENSIRKLLLGKWSLAFTATDENYNGIADEAEKEFGDEPAFITFNIDGTLTVTDAQGQAEEGTLTNWAVNGTQITLSAPADSFEEVQPYTIVSLNTIDMLWKTTEDSASFFFIGFTKEP